MLTQACCDLAVGVLKLSESVPWQGAAPGPRPEQWNSTRLKETGKAAAGGLVWLEEDGDLKKTLSRYFLLPVQPVTRTVHQHCSRGCCYFPACLEQQIGLGLGASPVKVGSLEKLLKKKLNGLLALALFLPT